MNIKVIVTLLLATLLCACSQKQGGETIETPFSISEPKLGVTNMLTTWCKRP